MTKDWIAFLMFFALFAGAMVAEILWLIRRRWASSRRSVAYVLATDLLSFGVGSSISFSLAFVMFMLVMGPAGTGSTGNESPMWIALIAALIFPPIILFLTKRTRPAFFQMNAGQAAWIYSLVATVLTFAIVHIPPVLFVYFA